MKSRLRVVNKAMAYIVKDNRLLVFTQDSPDSGVQIPAGTIKSGERARDAVLREAYEETGLEDLRVIQYLGHRRFDASKYKPEIHRRYFYLLGVTIKTKSKWTHFETHDGIGKPEAFHFYWADLYDSSLNLIAGMGDLLPKVRSR